MKMFSDDGDVAVPAWNGGNSKQVSMLPKEYSNVIQ
jgi:hypothetical protein